MNCHSNRTPLPQRVPVFEESPSTDRDSPPSTVLEPVDIDCTYFTTLDTAAAERRHQGSSLLESLLANKGYDMA